LTDLFREVEEDLRREQFSKLWDKYGAYLIGLAVGIVVLTAAIFGWRAWSHSQTVDTSARYDALVKEVAAASPEEAAGLYAAFAADASGGYAVLARLREADAQLAAGNRDAALSVYGTVAGNSAAPAIVRGMARVKAGLIEVDTLSYDDMKNRMAPLLTEGNPWRENALEILALSAAKAGVWADVSLNAQAIIANASSPAGLRDRAHVMQALAAPHLPRAAAEEAAPAPAEEAPADATEDASPEAAPAEQSETE
jgi:hypothetical protein